MDWTEITLPDAPPTGNVEFDRWLGHVTKHLRNYLGGLILNDNIANDAGDPAAWDFEVGDLTVDGAWQDLDLSGIVPAGSTMVLMFVSIVDDLVNTSIEFKKKGNSNDFNRSILRIHEANTSSDADIMVFCDSDRVIQYKATQAGAAFGGIGITVKGWLM